LPATATEPINMMLAKVASHGVGAARTGIHNIFKSFYKICFGYQSGENCSNLI
jgi:hypothetical protein